MSKCCQPTAKGMDPKLQFVVVLTAGLTSGLIVLLWSRKKRRQAEHLDITSKKEIITAETRRTQRKPNSFIEVPLIVALPGVPQSEMAKVAELDLAKMSPNYIKAVLKNLEDCEQAWYKPPLSPLPLFVRFMTTGKGIRPGYQIEAVSGENFQTFSGSNHVQRSPNRRLNAEHLSVKQYTKKDLQAAIER